MLWLMKNVSQDVIFHVKVPDQSLYRAANNRQTAVFINKVYTAITVPFRVASKQEENKQPGSR